MWALKPFRLLKPPSPSFFSWQSKLYPLQSIKSSFQSRNYGSSQNLSLNYRFQRAGRDGWQRPSNWKIMGMVVGIGIAYKCRKSVYDYFMPVMYAENRVKPLRRVVQGDEREVEIIKAPSESNVPPSTILRAIWQLLKPDVWLLLGVIVVTVALAVINISTPIVMGDLVSIIQKSVKSARRLSISAGMPPTTPISLDSKILNGPAIKLGALFIGQGLLTFLDIALVSKLGENLALRIRESLFHSILKQDMSFFDGQRGGEILGRLTDDVGEFKHTFKLVLTQFLKSAAQILGTGVTLFSISPKLTMSLLSLGPFIYVGLQRYGSWLRRLSKRAKEEESKSAGVASEAISNVRTVRSYAAEEREEAKFSEALTKSSTLNQYLSWHIGVFQGLTNSTIAALMLIILYVGGNLVASGDVSSGQLMTYMVATSNAQKSFANVGILFGQSIRAMGAAGRALEYIFTQPKIPTRGGLRLDELRGDVRFDHAFFSYPTRPDVNVLYNFSLQIPNGTSLALVGQSGSGKSTVAQLLARFYDLEQGSLSIDDYSIRELDPGWLRRNMAYVSQEPPLFNTSVLENIRYARPDAGLDDVIQAAIQANAHDFISQFPLGYEQPVGERGVTLSGGQRQRIAIARAFLANPSILILDEATSALDTQSEKSVQHALNRLMVGRTVLVIAHRLSTIESCDKIVVMSSIGKEAREDGNVVEQGSHNQLLSKRGAYYELYHRLNSEKAEREMLLEQARRNQRRIMAQTDSWNLDHDGGWLAEEWKSK